MTNPQKIAEIRKRLQAGSWMGSDISYLLTRLEEADRVVEAAGECLCGCDISMRECDCGVTDLARALIAYDKTKAG